MRAFAPNHRQFRDAQPMTHAMEPNMRSKLQKPLTLAAMSLGYGVVQLDVTIVNTALHSIGSALGGGVAELQWVVSTYTVAFAALILTAGALGDRMGAKKIFMAGFSIFTAASLACALAPALRTPVVIALALLVTLIGIPAATLVARASAAILLRRSTSNSPVIFK